MTSRDELRLNEMLEAIERSKGYAARGHKTFLSDYDTRELIIHHLEHLAESADQASQSFKKANPLVPWSDLRALRTRLVHEYMRPDPELVWTFVNDRMPGIERRLKRAKVPKPNE